MNITIHIVELGKIDKFWLDSVQSQRDVKCLNYFVIIQKSVVALKTLMYLQDMLGICLVCRYKRILWELVILKVYHLVLIIGNRKFLNFAVCWGKLGISCLLRSSALCRCRILQLQRLRTLDLNRTLPCQESKDLLVFAWCSCLRLFFSCKWLLLML